ncbi:DUF1501 domain-containing protein [Horticoccus sp. 23ND18S-11]|uniref:DUF1501 domain-containing protein n=1 Tax=Horticoccus sp. 23ND18S-11 TaxID=3391832 RepID=UPI0039C9FB6C
MHDCPADSRHLRPIPPGATRDYFRLQTRRQFFGRLSTGLGGAALSALAGPSLLGAFTQARAAGVVPAGMERLAQHAPKAKRAIYLYMGGAPSQIDTFDYKPALAGQYDKDMPASVLGRGQLNASNIRQARLPIVPSTYSFKQYGQSGAWVSELLPWTAKLVDEIAIVKSLHTDVLNHDAAVTYMLTGNAVAGKASIGAWVSYGLGSLSHNLPTFVVLVSKLAVANGDGAQAVFPRFWGNGFLPAANAGVQLRSEGDPVLYLRDPKGLSRAARRDMLDGVRDLNAAAFDEVGDPEIHARIQEFEMAFQMQATVPELTDLSAEPAETFELYGAEARTPGTFANHCLLARRMAERGVRFTQIFNRGWDSHRSLPKNFPVLCRDIDRPCHALVTDLKRRGMLDDTLVVWGGEFGRTVYCEGVLKPDDFGRDHHGKCFTMWLAGGGIKPGIVHGETDDFSFNVVRDPVHVRDLNATILHQLGLDHNRLTYRFEGLDQKLTGTVPARVVEELLI